MTWTNITIAICVYFAIAIPAILWMCRRLKAIGDELTPPFRRVPSQEANTQQMDLLRDDADPFAGLGYWTRANSEVCLLATRGKPKRLNADVRQGIIAPRREHSRKPDGIHERIERLVAGPYVELFARQSRPGWATWGNESTKFDAERQPSLLDEAAA